MGRLQHNDQQLDLSFGSPRAAVEHQSAAQELAGRLSQLLGERITLEVTNNAWTMVSFRRRADAGLCYRVHHMFLAAGEEVVAALAGFSGRHRRSAGRQLDVFIKKNKTAIRPRDPRPDQPLQPKGVHHDLQAIFDRLNAAHFENQIVAQIGWGRRAPMRRRHSIKMGVYFHDTRTIRLHPALDQAFVPGYFVDLIVFHEMLHQVFPPTEIPAHGDSRRTVHSAHFRAQERTFPDYARARAWELENLGRLLRSSRR